MARNPAQLDRKPSSPLPPTPSSALTPVTATLANFSWPVPLRPARPDSPFLAPSPIYPISLPEKEVSDPAVVADSLDNGMATQDSGSALNDTRLSIAQATTSLEDVTKALTSRLILAFPWPLSAAFDNRRFPNASIDTSDHIVSSTITDPTRPVYAPQISSSASPEQETLAVPSPFPFLSTNYMPPTAASKTNDAPTILALSTVGLTALWLSYTLAIPTPSSSKCAITNPHSFSASQPTQSPRTRFLHHLSTHQSIFHTFVLPRAIMTAMPQPSRNLNNMLTWPHPPSKEYLLQVCEESLMALRHELKVAETAAKKALSKEATTRSEEDALVSGFTSRMDVQDESQDTGESVVEEIEARDRKGKIPAGGMKDWIRLQELGRKREEHFEVSTDLCREKDRKASQVRSMESDVSVIFRCAMLRPRSIEADG